MRISASLAVLFVATAALIACRGAGDVPPPGAPAPGEVAAGATQPVPAAEAAERPEREVIIGELCPSAVDGRPGLVPMAQRRAAWTDSPAEAAAAVARREARQFSVLAWDGRRAGVFSALGMASVGGASAVAIGSYAGASPCAPAGSNEELPDCAAATRGCGVAIARLEAGSGLEARPYEEDADPVAFRTGAACVSGRALLVDVDGDGAVEAFVANQLGRDPELGAIELGGASCEPHFAVAGVGDGVDLLAVVDVDGDDRYELIAQRTRGGRREWLIYAAPNTAARLELVARAPAWR